eukprot:CAMPEP_0185437988 /NCGR_PEP_ID=MMETSP1365-20130426/33290_1 /TAXON_ID=38817 /ORGANISM="Gephyrocapsa oceanica, Strain RCC1303" /LENGTH=51 /DNA_ID=CAMNT_0028043101 /DNA_START=1 /DNA_END=152 /DNA_ORIENTATION=+
MLASQSSGGASSPAVGEGGQGDGRQGPSTVQWTWAGRARPSDGAAKRTARA